MPKIVVISKGTELRKIGARRLLDYITPFVRRREYIMAQRVPTLAWEKRWIREQGQKMRLGDLVKVVLMEGRSPVAICDAMRRPQQPERGNVHFAIGVAEAWRGRGWGEKLLRRGMAEARERMKPHKMWIEYVEGNGPAGRLYRKLGFVEIARLPEYHDHYGEWKDRVLMEYRGAKARRKQSGSRPRKR